MSVRLRQRTACADCGNRSRISPTEVSIHERYNRHWVWLYFTLLLCPICALARKEWLTLHGYKRQLVHSPR